MSPSLRSGLGVAWLLVTAGCLDNAGIDPPRGRFAFPIAVALAPTAEGAASERLYVVSSNFDLHYNAGALHALDLDALSDCEAMCRYRDGCLLVPEESEVDAPGRGFALERCRGLLASEVLLDSFASDMAISPDGSRLYVTVRSRANLTFVDVSDSGRLSCGGEGEPHRCSGRYRVDGGEQGGESGAGLSFPADPVALRVVSAGALSPSCSGSGAALWSVHRGGQVALFLDEGGEGSPQLLDVADGLGEGLSDAALRAGGVLWATSRTRGTMERAETVVDCTSPVHGELRTLPALRLGVLDTGRAASPQLRAVSMGEGADATAFVLSRSPRALLAVDVPASEASGRLVPHWSRPVCPGASALRRTVLLGEGGERWELLMVSCFDVNRLEVFSAADGRHLASIREMAGPYDFAFDPVRSRLYVADFSASVLRVFDTSGLADCLAGRSAGEVDCTPRLGWVVGVPDTVRELR